MTSLAELRESPELYLSFCHENDHLGRLLGHKFVSISKTECHSEYIVNPEHFNPNKILHGGTLYSLMDSSQGAFLHFIWKSLINMPPPAPQLSDILHR